MLLVNFVYLRRRFISDDIATCSRGIVRLVSRAPSPSFSFCHSFSMSVSFHMVWLFSRRTPTGQNRPAPTRIYTFEPRKAFLAPRCDFSSAYIGNETRSHSRRLHLQCNCIAVSDVTSCSINLSNRVSVHASLPRLFLTRRRPM